MVTIKDVARVCGLSPATVSQVLNNGGRPVNADTRQRVLEVARELGYRPNALARGLVGKRMNTIGVMCTGWDSPRITDFMTGVLIGIVAVCRSHKQNTMLITLDDWQQGEERLPEINDGRCDGILLVVPPENSSLPEILLHSKVPCVVVAADNSKCQVPSVDVDNFTAAMKMTEALIEQGHRRIAFVHSLQNVEFIHTHKEQRQAGYQQAMTAAEIFDPTIADLSEEDALSLSLHSSERPTAFFCYHDDMAIHFMDRLKQKGVRVPEDVSVIGFDDIPAAALAQPSLSTVRQPLYELGRRGAEVLLAFIDETISVDHRELLPTELVMRESIGRFDI